MILGLGIDVVDMNLFRDILNDPTTTFKSRHFTQKEIAYCEGLKGHDPIMHYAGRYAAKEACIKAGGVLFRNKKVDFNINYLDFEIATDADSGPSISLSGKMLEIFNESAIKKIHVSISHEKTVAAATVILEG